MLEYKFKLVLCCCTRKIPELKYGKFCRVTTSSVIVLGDSGVVAAENYVGLFQAKIVSN